MTGRALVAAGLLAAAGVRHVAVVRAAEPGRGAVLFERCAACHALEADAASRPGPSLKGLFGRRAATAPGFDYSPALRRAGQQDGLVWDEVTLDAFLADPADLVRGTWMGEVGLGDPADRAALIAFLRDAAR